jgi:hypothetical protein
VALGSAITYYLVNDGSSATAAISAAANVIVQDVGSDLYFDYTHTSGTVTVTVMAAGELIGSEEGLLPVLNPAFTGTMTGPAITLTGALTYGTKLVSTTALATPSALAATAFNAFASTVSGATVMGYGTTGDVTLKNRAGTTVAYVGPNTTAFTIVGAATLQSTLAVTSVATFSNNVLIGIATPSSAIVARYIALKDAVSSGLVLEGGTTKWTTYSAAGGQFVVRDETNAIAAITITSATAAIALGGTLAITGALTGVTTLAASSTILSSGPTGGIGYTTGAGGAQTQATNKQTGVTSNTITTAITMNNEALAADAITAFTFTNSAIAATDTVVVVHESAGTSGAYVCNAFPAAGSAVISVANRSAGALGEAIVLRVTVIKSVSA